MTVEQKRKVFDKLIMKIISRKLLVMVIATIAMFMGKIDPTNWTIIASAYVGTEAFIDGIYRLKSAKAEGVTRGMINMREEGGE